MREVGLGKDGRDGAADDVGENKEKNEAEEKDVRGWRKKGEVECWERGQGRRDRAYVGG